MVDKKTKNNAVSSYLLVFISFLFLFNKNNKYVNNDFVKAHTKAAFFLHILFLISFVVFKIFDIGASTQFFGYSLNNILLSSVFLFLFTFLLKGIYKASKGEFIKIGDFKFYQKTSSFVDQKSDTKLDEQDKMTIILSYIPFVGFFVYGKYFHIINDLLKNIFKLNSIITFSIFSGYLLGYNNLASLLLLAYIIYTVYVSIKLIVNGDIITINLSVLPTIEEFYIDIKVFFTYIKNYFSKSKFKPYSQIQQERFSLEKEKTGQILELVRTKKTINIYKPILYIPFVNFVFIFWLKSRYKYHIINSIFITFALILFWILFGFKNDFQYFLIFPTVFSIVYIRRLEFRLPVFYDIYILFLSIFRFIKSIFVKVKEIKEKETIEKHKVG